MNKVAIVTGGSSGIGKAVAMSLSQYGVKVYELSRRDLEMPGITHISTDVTDEQAVQNAVDEIHSREQHIDLLVNCAGFGISGAVEFTDTQDAKRQLDVNFFGTVRCVKAVLPYMRQQKNGRIVCISSVAGAIPIPFQTYYSVSKAAINSYVMALANEVKPFGISVCGIQPGDIASGFTAARAKNVKGDDVYEGRILRSVGRMEKDEQSGMSPEAAGRYIAKIALKKNVKPMYAIGLLYKFFCVLMRLLPCRLSNFILGLMYAS